MENEENKVEGKKKTNKKIGIIVLVASIAIIIAIVVIVCFITNNNEDGNNNIIEDNSQEVEDKIKPIITGFTNKEIIVGEEINILDGIKAEDDRDGEVEVSYEGEVDNSKPGEYTIKLIAKDRSNNVSEESFIITVKEKENNTEEVTDNEENKEEKVTSNEESKSQEAKSENSEVKSDVTADTQKPQTSNSKNDKTATSSNTQSTTKTETNSNAQTVAKPTKVDTKTEEKIEKTETKYGVKIETIKTTIYDVYSDGSKKEVKSSTRTNYDKTNYKATTNELLAEAKTLKSSNSGLINGVLKYVNQYREEANSKEVNGSKNRKTLTLDGNLTTAACARAMEMAYSGKFSHTRPNGSTCFSILNEMGISYYMCAENIASGQTSAASVSKSWKNSSGHYANMIGEGYTKIGIGVIKLNGVYYWVQLFT